MTRLSNLVLVCSTMWVNKCEFLWGFFTAKYNTTLIEYVELAGSHKHHQSPTPYPAQGSPKIISA